MGNSTDLEVRRTIKSTSRYVHGLPWVVFRPLLALGEWLALLRYVAIRMQIQSR